MTRPASRGVDETGRKTLAWHRGWTSFDPAAVACSMLKSEEFQQPVNNFIEENCVLFDGDDEHK